MKRVFLYIRVSTEEQAIHGLSIEAQTEALQEWAKGNGHKVVGVYTDAGISARKPASKRPALQRLLDDVRSGKGDLIVFTKLDRWFRNIAEYHKVQEILEKHKVEWRTIHEDYETSTASGRLKVNIMLSVAQDEADRTSERIKAVFDMKRHKLEAVTGAIPVGYKIEGKKFVKDPETEKAINAFFQTYLSRGSVCAAMDAAAECGLPMQYQRVHRMLDNELYCGKYFGMDGMTPSYITEEEFAKIQSMRNRTVRKTENNRVYFFSGLVVCGECGGRMGGRVRTNTEYRFYNCLGRYNKRTGCPNSSNMPEKVIEAYMLQTIRPEMDKRKLEFEASPIKKERDYQAEISAIKAKLEKLKDLYLNDIITLEVCKADQRKFLDKIAELEEKASKQEKPDYEKLERILSNDWEYAYNAMKTEKKQEFWRILLKEIRVYKDKHIEYDFNI